MGRIGRRLLGWKWMMSWFCEVVREKAGWCCWEANFELKEEDFPSFFFVRFFFLVLSRWKNVVRDDQFKASRWDSR